eukprot:gb/GECG01001027.1/.p1 GENE.gb/GECG01001027.1/~~gb/GECG01001027.1/.p1  ORF type:complete len:175 (+),score=24.56 gb/GECG01001027.1/:1-525(+)
MELKRTVDDAIWYSVNKYTRNQKRAKRYSGAAVTRRHLREKQKKRTRITRRHYLRTQVCQLPTLLQFLSKLLHLCKRKKNHSAEMYNRYRGEETGVANNSERDVAPTPTTQALLTRVQVLQMKVALLPATARDEEGSDGESSSASEANEDNQLARSVETANPKRAQPLLRREKQ